MSTTHDPRRTPVPPDGRYAPPPPVPPPQPPPPSRWHALAARVAGAANAVRRQFDRWTQRLTPAVLVALLAAAAGGAAAWVAAALREGCERLPVSLARLEVTYSATRFRALLDAEGECRGAVLGHFWPEDLVFALAYAAFLAALYAWVERWRRTEPGAAPPDPRDVPLPRRAHLVVLAPLAAGAFDVVENVALWWAARLVPPDGVPPSLGVWALVIAGSLAATAKWVLLLAYGYGLAAELLSGPRGVVLRRLRFSALAVALGGVPLLVVPQGQDILQRLVEGEHPWWRIASGVAAIAFGAHAVWYCGRKLLELGLTDDAEAAGSRWFAEFAEHGPRVLGLAALALGGAAFAQAGFGLPAFLAGAGGGLVVAILVEHAARRPGRRAGSSTSADGRGWRRVPDLPRRVGQVALAAAITGGVMAAWWWLAGPAPGDVPPHRRAQMRDLWVAAWLCVVAAWAFYVYVYYRRAVAAGGDAARLRRDRARSYNAVDPYRIPARLKAGVLAGLVASAAFLVLFAAWPVPVARALGPLWVLTLAVVNAVFFGSIMVWVHARWRVPVVRLALAAAVLFSLWNDNHVVRTVPDSDLRAADPRPALGARFGAWLDARERAGTSRDAPVVLVAAQGGGLRAAYWTATVLARAQDADPAFARRVFAISGVSGGSLGAAVFAAVVRDAGATAGGAAALPCARDGGPGSRGAGGAHGACVRRFMRDDFLSPVLAKLVAPDVAQGFLPFPVLAFDRSSALEGSWEASYREATGRETLAGPFLALADTADVAALPALFLNATHVETGRRYVAAPVTIDGVLHDAGDALRVLGADMPVAGAVHNSARFAYVSPAGRLDGRDGREHGRLVDGGYFENSGLVTVRQMLDVVRARGAPAGGPGRRVLVLYLCNDPRLCDADLRPERAAAVAGTSANELLAPARAVLHARGARGSLARAELADSTGDSLRVALGRDFVQLNVCADLPHRPGTDSTALSAERREERTRARARVVSPPLGWQLSQLARDWMDASLRPTPEETSACRERNARELDRLLALVRGAARE